MQAACVATMSSWLMISWLLPLAPVDIDFQVSFSRGVCLRNVVFSFCRSPPSRAHQSTPDPSKHLEQKETPRG